MAALPTRALAALLCLAAATAQQIAVANNWSPAASNAGLKPQRLQAYGHTHYYQLAEKPVAGTVVGGTLAVAVRSAAAYCCSGSCCMLASTCPRCCAASNRLAGQEYLQSRALPVAAALSHSHHRHPLPCTQVLIHGCGPNARSFFPYDPVNCVECLGESSWWVLPAVSLRRCRKRGAVLAAAFPLPFQPPC